VKPRLHFSESAESDVISDWGRTNERQTPHVIIEIECDHDDVAAGLAVFDSVVERIRGQFQRTIGL
jgi:hypothetical protein